jgi:thymidylate synthase (FAD)
VKIIQPSFVIDSPANREEGIALLRTIEHCARVSHASEDKQTDDSWERFLTAVVMQKGDWSVCEHASAHVTLRIDRGCTHEIVRHRLFSFTQSSTRFINYSKHELEFIEPEWNLETCANGHPYYLWSHAMWQAEQDYLDLLKSGQPPQIARSVLPNATVATLVMTGNLRSWRWLFLMRCTKETHPDLRRVMVPLLKEFQNRIPLLFDDVNPLEKQSVSLSRPK